MEDKENKFKLDRTVFKIVSFEDKGNNIDYWLSKTPMERLETSWYLNCQAYNIPFSADHRVDRTVFRIKKFGEK
ncbi:MAG: hypothetical protein RLZZ546_654 [Bacteroidota bacterium]|jgi:hypothetical protein